jgi:hypothetical protein
MDPTWHGMKQTYPLRPLASMFPNYLPLRPGSLDHLDS